MPLMVRRDATGAEEIVKVNSDSPSLINSFKNLGFTQSYSQFDQVVAGGQRQRWDCATKTYFRCAINQQARLVERVKHQDSLAVLVEDHNRTNDA